MGHVVLFRVRGDVLIDADGIASLGAEKRRCAGYGLVVDGRECCGPWHDDSFLRQRLFSVGGEAGKLARSEGEQGLRAGGLFFCDVGPGSLVRACLFWQRFRAFGGFDGLAAFEG